MRAYKVAHCAVFDRLGLRDIGQPMMLFVLSDARCSGKQCTQTELCSILHLSASTVTMSIKSLERRGYVRRRADQEDMRRNIVEITESGAETAELCRRAFDDIDRAMYAGFSPEQRHNIAAIFEQITNNLLSLKDAGGTDREEDGTCSENSSNS
jgi:DNA-binding MarR family transcriptional regulator